MTRTYTNSLAAIAAVFLAITSISTIVTVPPAQAHSTHDVAQMIELA
ncbi:hypothetical protein [uncultured Erythrobacter sp.]|jgi:hypothetical protein|nr:hypothetical protein [uncultured Erythrobacter sp.]